MAALLKRIIWFRLKSAGETALPLDNDYDQGIDITDDINWNVGKGLDIKNNILSLQLKNADQRYVGSDGNILFNEQDQIKIYLK